MGKLRRKISELPLNCYTGGQSNKSCICRDVSAYYTCADISKKKKKALHGLAGFQGSASSGLHVLVHPYWSATSKTTLALSSRSSKVGPGVWTISQDDAPWPCGGGTG